MKYRASASPTYASMRRKFTGAIKLAAVLATGTLLASECFATRFKCDADHAAAYKGVCTGMGGSWDSPVGTPRPRTTLRKRTAGSGGPRYLLQQKTKLQVMGDAK